MSMAGPARIGLQRLPVGVRVALRTAAWVGLAGVTVWLARGEVLPSEVPAGVRLIPGLVYSEADGATQRLDVYEPTAPRPAGGRPAVVAVHGGGWRGGGRRDYGRTLAGLAAKGLAVFVVDYRLSRPGSSSWPGNRDDVRRAVRWVRRNAKEFGVDADRVALLGASAGGHLALLAGLDAAAPGDPGRVRAVVDFYGPTDLAALADPGSPARESVVMMLGGPPGSVPSRYSAASPLGRVGPGSPPVLILHGDADALIPPSQSRRLAAALASAGVAHRLVVLGGARHGFGLNAGGRDLTPDILAFLAESWGPPARQ